VQVKLRDPLRTRAIPEHLRGVFTTRHYTYPRFALPLPLFILITVVCNLYNYMLQCGFLQKCTNMLCQRILYVIAYRSFASDFLYGQDSLLCCRCSLSHSGCASFVLIDVAKML